MMPKVPKNEKGEAKGTETPETGASGTEEKPPVNNTNRSTSETSNKMSTLELSILFKFIKPYDGSRETLNSFLVNCDNALSLAADTQEPILFKFILSQLNGKAEVACSIKDFNSWDQLKDFLKTQFSERKHYSHLLTDLQENKQGLQESVSQYALRTETYLSQLLTEISFSNTKAKELPGRTAAMEDLALHHFLMGLHPRISNIVRSKSPKSLNEAINFAISEERIQQTLYRRPQAETKTNNNIGNKFKAGPSKPFNSFTQSPRPFFPTQQGTSNLFCRYCKTSGHDISACKKREYNNNRFKFQQSQATNRYASRPPPRVNFFEQSDEAEMTHEGHDEVDNSENPLNE